MAEKSIIDLTNQLGQSIQLATLEVEKNVNTARFYQFLMARKENEEEAIQRWPEFEEYYQKSLQPKSDRMHYEDTLGILCPKMAEQRDQAYKSLGQPAETEELIRDEMFNVTQKMQQGTFKKEDTGDVIRSIMGAIFKDDEEKLNKINQILAEVEANRE